MPSTFLGLNTSYTGLVAANAALNTTANNIANVETKGYSRQQINQSAASAMRAFASYGCIGAGVDTLGAERIRDIYYDEKYWNNNSKLGEYEKKSYYAEIIQTYLEDVRDTKADGSQSIVKGFTTLFNEFHNSLESLATHTGDIDYARTALSYGGNLCEYFNILYNNFQKMQTDVNDEIKIEIDQINSVSQQLSTLNQQINMIEVNGTAVANELRDKRDLLIDQLSKYIDVKCEERVVYNEATGEDSVLREYVVRIAGGQILVDGKNYRQLECVPRERWQEDNQNDVGGLYDIRWTDTKQDANISGKTARGELKGLLEMRDGNNNEAFNGTVSSMDTVERTVTIEVTDDYLKDMSKSTLPLTEGRISIGGKYYYYDSYEVQKLSNGECFYTFKMSDVPERNPRFVPMDKIGQPAKIGDQINYQGIPYYLEQMNEWVREYASIFNGLYSQEGATDYFGQNETGSVFFTGDRELGGQFGLDVERGAMKYSSTDEGYFQLTAGNFNVSKRLEDEPRYMATHTIYTDGESKYDIIEDLIDLSTNIDKMQFRGCSAESFLECLMGDSALNASSAENFTAVFSKIEESIENDRLSISGVDNDEEAANMMKYQTAFGLASKMISVLNQCYEQLILQTGV